MDAFVQVAMIEKARRVFAEDPEIMLSFPLLWPLSFTAADIAALASPATAQDYATAGDFARAVNFLPRDMVASVSERTLWDVYGDVLARAETALGETGGASADAPSPSLLWDILPDGGRRESEAVLRYRQYRDAWFVAREDYASHRLTGELSTEAGVRQRWVESDEPALRAIMDAAASDWETLGRRSEIEAAMASERARLLRSPQRRWEEWHDGFNPDIDLVTEADGSRYAPTGLSPDDFIEGDWPRFTLSADEMRALVDQAPANLKRLLQDGDRPRLDSISFEYRSVALVRPWFRPEALTSRIWRSEDPDLQLSEGTEPPAGTCPAYATACVFVRHLTVTEAGTPSGRSFRDLRFTLDPNLVSPRPDVRIDPARILRQRAAVSPQASVPASPPRPSRAFQTLRLSTFKTAPTIAMPQRAPAFRGRLVLRSGLTTRLGGIRLPAEVIGPPRNDPPPSAPEPVREDLTILAFICKRLPKAPDPAPGLDWS